MLSGKSDELEASEPFRLASMIQVGIQYGEVLSEKDWQFIHSPEDQRFITSDNPVICETRDLITRERFTCVLARIFRTPPRGSHSPVVSSF